jgi:putative transcriptional regulator
MAAPDLVAPVLLLAMPQVNDPFFKRSVVLLLAHEETEGSFGFIVNRPTELRLADVLRDLDLEWRGAPEEKARFGGPVQPQVGTMLFAGGTEWAELLPHSSEVLAGVRVSQNLSELGKIALAPPARFRLMLGYAGWGAGQLTGEIVRNDWLTAPVDLDLVFARSDDETWARAVRSAGVDPELLPAWTGREGDEAAN